MFLTDDDKQAIEARVRALEAATGVEVVTMVVGKSDVYPEIVWKAFALGTSLAALAVSLWDFALPGWHTAGAALAAALVILGAGAASATVSLYVPAFARLFLRDARAALEVTQYAEVQFLGREMFATAERTAILLLASLLERRVVLLADSGLRRRIHQHAWDTVIARMTPLLRERRTGAAMLAGLDAIDATLRQAGCVAGSPGNRFPDPPVEVRAP